MRRSAKQLQVTMALVGYDSTALLNAILAEIEDTGSSKTVTFDTDSQKNSFSDPSLS